jgi:hypothetical protein
MKHRFNVLHFRVCLTAAGAGLVLTYSNGIAAELSVTSVTSDNGLPAHSVQWTDATGQPRTAIMVDQRPEGAGYLRQVTYLANGVSRVCRGTGDDGHQGDGYVQNHTANGGDSSSHVTPGTTTVVLAGAHHAILSYAMPNYNLDGHTVPTTVQWFFADGRSHPLFMLSQDARATAGNLGADSRSPYGDVAYDGLGAGATIGGASFGDTYKFVTLAAAPEQVTRASGWRYNEPNSIPYAMQWADPAQVDAEMGHVATVPITVQDQGSDPRSDPFVEVRGTQQLNGPMIDDENWAYQVLNYVLPATGPTGSRRLTWGTQWGLPGGFDNYGDASLNVRQYSQHASDPLGEVRGGARADGMLMAYSVFVVLGTHSGGYLGGTVGQMVKQMENTAVASLTAATGTVKANGPAGVGNAASATVTYAPAGYNPIFSTWEVVASANTVDATLTPVAGAPLDHPVFVVNGYTLSQLPASISVGVGLGTPDVDYFATLDATHQQLWITVNRIVSSPLNLKVIPGGGGAQPPVINSIPASGAVGASIQITGNNFTGVTGVTFNGVSATFTVDSPTQITAVVPAGATAGAIAVITSAGTATSATNFAPISTAPPPTLTLKSASASSGLKIVSGPGLYDRQNIATDTTTNDYGWIGAVGPAAVTYAITIADFPPQAYRGFQAHIFLVPNSTGSTAPDYAEPSVVMLDIQAQADGTATAWLRYKLNTPNDNSFIYGAGTIGQVDCTSGPLGTWSLSLTSNTSAKLTAPDGNSTLSNFPDPTAIQQAFGGKVTVYFGNQANDLSQVGQSTTYSRIQISGTPRAQLIDETFPGPNLNDHPANVAWHWDTVAASPAGISLPTNAGGLALVWTLPDTGYALQFSPSLSPAVWSDPGFTNIISQGASKMVFIPKSALPNATRFFRMIKKP